MPLRPLAESGRDYPSLSHLQYTYASVLLQRDDIDIDNQFSCERARIMYQVDSAANKLK